MLKKIQTYLGTTILFTAIIFTSCEDTYIPKPSSYPRIEYPASKNYQLYSGDCPFTFKTPQYTEVVRDTQSGAQDCWLNINYKPFNAKLHLSYKPVSNFKNFYEMSEDARTFAFKHTTKAEDISERYYRTTNGVSGILYEIEGNTASSVQFFATDSTKHYLRGALYFNTRPNKDSLEPVIKYLRTDIDTFIQSLKWKEWGERR
jgi:gliding motility-associated lipoprotein GldD